jgi:hypothetical protein
VTKRSIVATFGYVLLNVEKRRKPEMSRLKRIGIAAVMSMALALLLITGASAQTVKSGQSNSAHSAVATIASHIISAANTQQSTRLLRASWGSWGWSSWSWGFWDGCGCWW